MVFDVKLSLTYSKWLRVLFYREFTDSEAIKIWDSIFAYYFAKGNIDIVDYITVAMVEHLKEYILQQIDVSGVLQRVMKYQGEDASFIIHRAHELEGCLQLR